MKEFSDVYKASVSKVYRFLLGLCHDEAMAEELTEETFYQAFLNFQKFEGRCSVDTWLCQIAKNLYFREQKRNKRFLPWQGEWGSGTQDDFSGMEQREEVIQLHRLVHGLEEPYREVFMLKVFGDLTFQEIADISEKSLSWAKMTYYRAKAKIVTEAKNRGKEVPENGDA